MGRQSGTPLDEGLPHAVMQWWRTFAKSEHAVILPAVAMKIYSVRVNSMPEERTVSTFTALTPKLRSRLSVQSMTAMTQIRQYYQTEAKKTRPHVQPNLRFHHIKKKLFPTSDAAEDPMPDDDGDDWIDEPPSDDISLESDLTTHPPHLGMGSPECVRVQEMEVMQSVLPMQMMTTTTTSRLHSNFLYIIFSYPRHVHTTLHELSIRRMSDLRYSMRQPRPFRCAES
ncbi:hypothetical protein FA95DRAFT_126059 [Auriscalpium vulgare]|uniref:Uncharacterized protein n=1 Tax=Auriscalpium vulgare TaxID=40419 RepID=A0ACB8RN80_9AGAM|nr:hypothetical protein FA95DRAFT_126059 [Auriscalpium vulgare]